MKTLLLSLVLILTGCASDKAHDPTAEQARAIARIRGAGSCGHPETAKALSAHKWCAAERAADDMETILFKLSDCSVALSTTILVIDQAGNEKQVKNKKFGGSFLLDLESNRPLHVTLEESSPIYHSLTIAPDNLELTLTDEKYVPCNAPAEEVQPEVEPETEGGTEI